MKLARTDSFKRDYKKLPERVKRQTDKALKFLAANVSHPSLRAKKIKSKEGIWEARVTRGYRFSFEIRGDTYILRRVGRHKDLLREP